MFEEDNNLDNSQNSSGEVFHNLNKEEISNITGGADIKDNSLKHIFAVSSMKCIGSTAIGASIGAVLGAISYHHC